MIEQQEAVQITEECLTVLEQLNPADCLYCLEHIIATVVYSTANAGDEDDNFYHLCKNSHTRLVDLCSLDMKEPHRRHLRCLN